MKWLKVRESKGMAAKTIAPLGKDTIPEKGKSVNTSTIKALPPPPPSET